MNIFKLRSNHIIMQRFMNIFETESTFYEHSYATFNIKFLYNATKETEIILRTIFCLF